jgi:agmatinase
MLRGLAGAGETIAGADVVEVAPAYDPAGQTAVAAANAAYELVSVMAMERAARSGGEH